MNAEWTELVMITSRVIDNVSRRQSPEDPAQKTTNKGPNRRSRFRY